MTEPIREFAKEGIVTDDGTVHPLDVIVLATGYNVNGALGTYNIYGKSGVLHTTALGETPRMFLGVTYPGAFQVV